MTEEQRKIQPIGPRLLPAVLSEAGQAANQAAARHRFADYRSRRSEQTLRRQDADLNLFAEFLTIVGVRVNLLNQNPEAWRGVSWGLVEAFVKWQLKEGYAVPSVNVRLSTVKTYARLAFQAGTVSAEEYALIRAVQGYSQREKRRIDSQRPVQRVGLKKASPVALSLEQIELLKSQPLDSPQGCRDALMLCLLLDHGLRVGEVAQLKRQALDVENGSLRFYRSKVGKEQVHRLSADTLRVAKKYLKYCPSPVADSALLLRMERNGQLGKRGISVRGIAQRVSELGEQSGIRGLSPHDCRHAWATRAAKAGTDPFRLQEAGGWSSLAMPRRYVEAQEIANEGLRLYDPPEHNED